MTHDEEQEIIRKEFEAMFGKYDKEQGSLYTDRPAQKPEYYTNRVFDERLINPTFWTKICLFLEEIQTIHFHFPKLEEIYYFIFSPMFGSGDIDGENDYKCHCKCDLKECDYVCAEYFATQDWKPYRKADMNLPSLKHIPIEEKIKSYRHFQKMLNKRNRNPYFALYYYLRIREFNKLLKKNK